MTVHPGALSILEMADDLRGHMIEIDQSISRDRARGHDPHCSTSIRLRFVVTSTNATFNGAQLLLNGKDMWCGFSLGSIVDVDFGPPLLIVERYGDSAERRSTIKIVGERSKEQQ